MKKTEPLKKGLTTIITGASSGIGKALAILLAEKYQAKLVLTARTLSALEETKLAVEKHGGEVVLVTGDIAESHIQEQIVQTCIDRFGRIDLLVNNAGFAKPGKLIDLTPDDWQKVFAVNFFAPLNTIYMVLPHFIEKGIGRIVNISSVAGKVAFPGSVCYAASKFALTGMSEGMAAELANKNIDVITVCPGWVRTEFFEKNHMSDKKNPTMIAQKNDFFGWMMRNVLSISSEDTANEILRSLEKGGSAELVLTAPGVTAERIAALFPSLMAELSKMIPLEYVDSAKSAKVDKQCVK
jgi:short-subunit dehydrogenase